MYKLLLVIIGVTSVSIIAAIILIIKNHKLGDTPESEDYFPSDDFDEEQDLDAAEYDRYSAEDGSYPAGGYADGGYSDGGYNGSQYPADGYGYGYTNDENYDEYNDLDAFDDLGSKDYAGDGSSDNYFEPGRDIYRPGREDNGGYAYRPEDFMPKDPNGK